MNKCCSLFLVFLFGQLAAFAQVKDNYQEYLDGQIYLKDHPNGEYSNTISIEPVPFIIGVVDHLYPLNEKFSVLSLTYSHKLSYSTELTITPRFQVHSLKDGDLLFDFYSRDPFWLYDEFSLRFGYREFLVKKFYVEPQIGYMYGEFSNRWITYEREEYSYYKDYLITRNFQAVGANLLWGIARSINRFQINFYCGMGVNFKYIDETKKAVRAGVGSYIDETIHERNYYWLTKPAVFLGFKVGFNFKKSEFHPPVKNYEIKPKPVRRYIHRNNTVKIDSAKNEPPKNYVNTISIEPASLALNYMSLAVVSFTFGHKMNENTELTVTPRFQYRWGQNEWIITEVKDPFWDYSEFSVRIGLRKMMHKKLYLEPLFNYMYGEFLNNNFEYSDGSGFQQYTMTRNFHAAGLGIISGFLQRHKRIETNVYCGIGMNVRYVSETIKDRRLNSQPIDPSGSPERSHYFLPKLAIYAGLKIGYIFTKKLSK